MKVSTPHRIPLATRLPICVSGAASVQVWAERRHPQGSWLVITEPLLVFRARLITTCEGG